MIGPWTPAARTDQAGLEVWRQTLADCIVQCRRYVARQKPTIVA